MELNYSKNIIDQIRNQKVDKNKEKEFSDDDLLDEFVLEVGDDFRPQGKIEFNGSMSADSLKNRGIMYDSDDIEEEGEQPVQEDYENSDIKFLASNNVGKSNLNEEESLEEPEERFVESIVTFDQKGASPEIEMVDTHQNNQLEVDSIEPEKHEEPEVVNNLAEYSYPIEIEKEEEEEEEPRGKSYFQLALNEERNIQENSEEVSRTYMNMAKSTLPTQVSSNKKVESLQIVKEEYHNPERELNQDLQIQEDEKIEDQEMIYEEIEEEEIVEEEFLEGQDEGDNFSISDDSVKRVNIASQLNAPRKSLGTLGTSYAMEQPRMSYNQSFKIRVEEVKEEETPRKTFNKRDYTSLRLTPINRKQRLH